MKKLKQHKAFTKLSNPYVLNTLMVFGMLLIVFKITGIAPFGDRTIASLDLKSQYTDMYNYFVNVFTGQDGFHYSFYKGSGGGMFALWTYYLMSPFNLVYLIFNQENMLYGVHLVYVMKILALTLTTTHYLVKKQVTAKINLTLTLGFVFSNYLIMNGLHLMWWDAFILLPLLTLALDRGLTTGKWGRYTLLLTLTIYVNFYIGYMVGLFTLIYVLYKYLTKDKEIKYNFWGYVRNCIYSGIMSLWVLIPTANTIIGSHSHKVPKTSIFNTYDMGKVFLNSRFILTTVENYTQTTPLLMMGTLIIILLLTTLIVTHKKYRRSFLIVLSIYVLSYIFRTISYIWTMGQDESWYLYRYTFTLLWFVVIFLADNKGLLFTQMSKGVQALNIVVLVLPSIYMILSDAEGVQLVGWVALIFSVIYSVFIIFHKKLPKNIFILLHIVELLLMSLWGYGLIHITTFEQFYKGYNTYTEQIKPYTQMEDGDRIYYETGIGSYNRGMSVRETQLTHTSSTISQGERRYITTTGLIESYSYTGAAGNTVFSDAMNNVKYVWSQHEFEQKQGYEHIEEDKLNYNYYLDEPKNNYTKITDNLYQNNNQLGVGYTVTPKDLSDVKDYPLNLITQALFNKTYVEPYTPKVVDTKNITLTGDKKHYKVSEDEVSEDEVSEDEGQKYKVTYEIDEEDVYTYYVHVPVSIEHDGTVDSIEYMTSVHGSGTAFLYTIPNTKSKVTYSLEGKGSRSEDMEEYKLPQFYKVNTQEFISDIQEFYNHHSPITELQFGNQSITGKVDNQYGDSHLQLNLPYDEGWSAFVNGSEVETLDYISRLTLPIPSGTSDIQLTYRTPYLTESVLLSFIGLAFYIVELVYLKKREDKQT